MNIFIRFCAVLDLILIYCLVFVCSNDYITYKSLIKLKNEKINIRLHSHDVKYGSGSGQQSVTGNTNIDDENSFWLIKGPMKSEKNKREPVECNSIIRLEHFKTKRNLHSHEYSSPITHNQEVSCFGDEGKGDSGDHWYVKCSTQYWVRGKDVQFQHVDTKKYLAVSEKKFGRPISGQYEIVAIAEPSKLSKWRTSEGIYFNTDPDESRNAIKDEL